MPPSTIIHIPHAVRCIPVEYRGQFVVDDITLERELDRLVDHYTDALFELKDIRCRSIIFPLSRVVVDPERFDKDADEPMAAMGQGVIYSHMSNGHPLRREISVAERNLLIESWYRPHHAALERATRQSLDAHGKALIIDAHSFPNRPLAIDLDQQACRPDICLGTDPMHTPPALTARLAGLFDAMGYRVAINQPYAGCMVPGFAYRSDPRVSSIMIELNRRLYLVNEPHDCSKSSGYARLRQDVMQVLHEALEWFEALSNKG